MKKGRSRTATVALCLVALAFTLSLSSAGVLPLFSLVKLPPSISQSSASTFSLPSPPPSQTGTLVVKSSFFGEDGSGGVVTGASVSVTDVDSGLIQANLVTNSSGEVQILLDTGNYSVRVSSSEFNTTANAQVYQNRVTEIDVVTSSAQSLSPQSPNAEHRGVPSSPAGILLTGGILMNPGLVLTVHVKNASTTSTEALYCSDALAYRGERP